MDYMDRNEDLMKVFDRTWKANHNDDVQRARAKEKKIWNKMFDTSNALERKNKVVTPQDRLNNLNENIKNASDIGRNMKVNNIINKWK